MMHHLNFCSNEQATPLLKFNLAVLPKIDSANICLKCSMFLTHHSMYPHSKQRR